MFGRRFIFLLLGFCFAKVGQAQMPVHDFHQRVEWLEDTAQQNLTKARKLVDSWLQVEEDPGARAVLRTKRASVLIRQGLIEDARLDLNGAEDHLSELDEEYVAYWFLIDALWKDAVDNLPEALRGLQRADSTCRDCSLSQKIRFNFGFINQRSGNYDKAYEVYRGLLQSDMEDHRLRGMIRLNLGGIYNFRGQTDSARVSLNRALKRLMVADDHLLLGQVLVNMAKLEMPDHPEIALDYLRQAEWYLKRSGEQASLARVMLDKSKVLIALGSMSESRRILEEVQEKAEDSRNLSLKMLVWKSLSEYWNAAGDYRQAYDAQINYKAYSDSVEAQRNEQAVRKLQLQYDLTQYQERLKEERQARKHAETDLNRVIVLVVLSLLVLALALVLVVILRKRNRKARETNAKLVEQRTLLERAMEELRMHNDSKKQVLEVLGHDLGNPLARISTSLELALLSGPEDHEELRTTMSQLHVDLRQLQNTFANLMRWARSAERRLVNLSGSYPVDIINRLWVQDERLAAERNMVLKLELNNSLCLKVESGDMEVILRNALGNALKYGLEGSSIRVFEPGKEEGAAKLIIANRPARKITDDVLHALNHRGIMSGSVDAFGHKGMGIGHLIIHELSERNGGQARYVLENGELQLRLNFQLC